MKSLLICLLISMIPTIANSQSSDDILGRWQSGHGSGQIQIFKRGDLYYGKIVWLKSPDDASGKAKLDAKNPKKDLRTRPIIGMEVLKDFDYKGKGTWANGKIYDPKSGNTYNSQMTLPDRNKLNIRAFFGLNILGKTETWTRVDEN